MSRALVAMSLFISDLLNPLCACSHIWPLPFLKWPIIYRSFYTTTTDNKTLFIQRRWKYQCNTMKNSLNWFTYLPCGSLIRLKGHCPDFSMILESSETYLDHRKLNNNGLILDKWQEPIRKWGWQTTARNRPKEYWLKTSRSRTITKQNEH